MTEKGVLTSIKNPATIFKKHRERLKAVRDPNTLINTKITEETPKVRDPEIQERLEKFKGRDAEDVAQGA